MISFITVKPVRPTVAILKNLKAKDFKSKNNLFGENEL